MRTAVVSLAGYENEIVKLLTAVERGALENHLAENPEIHPVVSGTGGVRKARWSRGASGKSGGIRVIYYFMSHRGAIYMMRAYAKSRQTTLSASDKKIIKRLVAEIKNL
jgi:mRNA-degrading endonuclease RelE of RelBE toxin-antitoxin system